MSYLWTPGDITTQGWWDPSDTSTITESGGSVSQLDDLSGNSRHLTQATGANQPTTGTRTQNSLNILDGDGGDYLDIASFPVDASGDCMLLAIAEIDSVSTINDSVYCMDGTNDWQLAASNASQFNGAMDVSNIGADKGLTGGPFPGPSIYCCVFDYAGTGYYNAFIDGTQRTTNTTYTNKLSTSQTLRFFANRASDRSPNGAFGEFVVLTDVTTATRQKIEGYLAHKWGLSANLPGGHPYENLPPFNYGITSKINYGQSIGQNRGQR